VHAAAGGVGGFAIQLAKATKAFVIGTCSEPNTQYVRELGADEGACCFQYTGLCVITTRLPVADIADHEARC
jgi:NADPH:quinone reductase-like Zn-dependent oxidoreductase